jgi:hypothetical protein
MNLHPTTLRTNIPTRELGGQIVGLRYDLLLEVVMGMVDEFNRQAFHDLELDRKKLSNLLMMARKHMVEVETVLNEICRICEPYIAEEKSFEKNHLGHIPLAYSSVSQRFTSYKLPV